MDDPSTGTTRSPARPAVEASRRLPADVAAFAGRAGAIARLDEFLAGGRPMLITGPAGVGKTALAVHYAHRLAGRFPGGRLLLDLRGLDAAGDPLPTGHALRLLLAELGVALEDIPADLDSCAVLYQRLLADRPVFLVLDNASTADQVRPLLPGTGPSVALVTSRGPLEALGRPVTLGPLDRTEARAVLTGRIGADRVAAAPAAVDHIISACARLPLALTIVSARAVLHPSSSLPQIAAALDLDPRSVFAWSYGLLSGPAQRLFRLIGLHPGADLAPSTAAALLGLSTVESGPPLAELARAQLVGEHRPGRFAMHGLLRSYAVGLEPRVEHGEAQRRLVEHYTHSAAAAALVLNPARPPLAAALTRTSAVPVHRIAADDAAAAAALWFATEHRSLLSITDLALRRGQYREVCQLSWALSDFLDRAGHHDDRVTTRTAARTAAVRLGDPGWLALTHNGVRPRWSGPRG